ncbi:MAG: response regulator transcription factor [Saprospiraceae bacterium]|nr:response regulator transcription factor [Saprospiraceae bacterium]MBK7787957.1 response regulator transcription factor [Saprospiraceae bacterium]MBK8851818.1 response regulator transcription factor [Saprospiraceae bacterium]
MNYKILIYDDNHDLRNSLKLLLEAESDFEVVGDYEDCLDIIRQTTELSPDVILMDIDMPKMNGVKGVTLVKKEFPAVEVIMHTVFDDNDNIFNALTAGASGYILKNESNENVIHSIKELLAGGAPMSPSIARKLVKFHQQKPRLEANAILSPREMEIIQELSKGLSYKMVAAKLFISIETVRSHCKKIYEKLHVHSLAEALHKIKS